ncbi:hypothetical protein QBC33DRAFT_241546 [Phialemonium atrogriseum]|uniref:Uncharacterized protein n=1 Tax=Phialemonium atrogriseum TaxID=1093897 RepID=A0AAJ0BSB1_9PEZI|nr:uncharacterized protein QBC33DRAFT_241546 [Phialemonium atrogriseum]KAK1763569.1 hypothetical protein QBC33DRAFT_241546 [Phialemonium atrogriseum]
MKPKKKKTWKQNHAYQASQDGTHQGKQNETPQEEGEMSHLSAKARGKMPKRPAMEQPSAPTQKTRWADMVEEDDASEGEEDHFTQRRGGTILISKRRNNQLMIDIHRAQGYGSERLPTISEPAQEVNSMPAADEPPAQQHSELVQEVDESPALVSQHKPHGSYRNLPRGFDPFPRAPSRGPTPASEQASAQSAAQPDTQGPGHPKPTSMTSHAIPSRPSSQDDPPLTSVSRVTSAYWTARSGPSSRENSPPSAVPDILSTQPQPQFVLSVQQLCDPDGATARSVADPTATSDTESGSCSRSPLAVNSTLNPKAAPFVAPGGNAETSSQATSVTVTESSGQDTANIAPSQPGGDPGDAAAGPVIVRSPRATNLAGQAPTPVSDHGPSRSAVPDVQAHGQGEPGGSNSPPKKKGKGKPKGKGKEKVPVVSRPRSDTAFKVRDPGV